MTRLLFAGLCLCWLTACSERATAPPLGDGTQTSHAAPDEQYTFGMVPYSTPTQVADEYDDFVEAIGESLDRRLNLRTTSSFERWRARLREERYDFAYVTAVTFLELEPSAYRPFAQLKDGFDLSLVVTRESALSTLAQLEGSTVAVTTRNLAPLRAYLIDAGLDPNRDIVIEPGTSDDGCLQAVLVGLAAACASLDQSTAIIETQLGVRFRVLARLPQIPPALLVAHDRVPATDVDRVRALVTTLADHATGRRVLDAISTSSGFEPFQSTDLEPARRLLIREARP